MMTSNDDIISANMPGLNSGVDFRGLVWKRVLFFAGVIFELIPYTPPPPPKKISAVWPFSTQMASNFATIGSF